MGLIPADGKPHDRRLKYEPEAVVPKEWADPALRDALGTVRRPETEILAALRKAEPGLTEGELRKRLGAAMELGLIQFHTRRGVGWEIRQDPERDFHAKHDFGFSRTDFAGTAAGEIGGTFWRTEAVDPVTRITRPKR